MFKVKKKWLRRTLRVIAVSVALIFIFVYFFLEGIVISRLESKLDNSYGKSYAITYNKINYSVSFTSLSVELTDVKIKTDTVKAKKNKSPVIDLESKSVGVSKMSLWSFFVLSEMDVSTITIDTPHLSIAKNKEFEIDDESKPIEEGLDISTNIKSIRFDEFKINNGSVVFYKDVKMTDTLFRLNDLDFRALEFESVKENLSELLIMDKYSKLSVESKSFNLNLGEDNYTIFVKKFDGELIAGDLQLKDIHFKPPTDKLRSGKEYRGDVKINQLNLYGVKHIMDDKINLSADTAVIIDTHIDLTKNQALSNQREKVLWMENLLSLKEELSINILKFKNCSLASEIKKLDGDKNYKLELTKLNGEISNINTKGDSENLKIELQSNVFKTGELNMTVTFPYDDPLVSNFEGTISNIDLKSFNELIVKMFSLKIEEGMLSTLSFRGKSYDNVSKGKLTFEYKDLNGSFIKESNGERKQALLISKLMNLVIHSSNPRSGKTQPEEVEFVFTKEKHHGQIMLWLGGIIDGTVLTIIGKKKHDFLLNRME